MMARKRAPLGSIGAVWCAFREADVSYFPRFTGPDGKERRIDPDELIRRISDELGTLKGPPDDQIEALIRRGRESLDEVKGLTEYEDQKATRNLTIITFLSALAGVLFSRFADIYPIQKAISHFDSSVMENSLVAAGYFLFFLFVACAISGALVIFHATRIRFKYPNVATDQSNDGPKNANSFLFFTEIIQVTPENWASSFLETRPKNSEARTLRKNLSEAYLKNYIVESYLIAAKVADKLRYLMPAQTLLSFSIKVLLVWLFITMLTFVAVPVQNNEVGGGIAQMPPTPAEPIK